MSFHDNICGFRDVDSRLMYTLTVQPGFSFLTTHTHTPKLNRLAFEMNNAINEKTAHKHSNTRTFLIKTNKCVTLKWLQSN